MSFKNIEKKVKITDDRRNSQTDRMHVYNILYLLPGLKQDWRERESMGNRTIKKAIDCDRFMVISSKPYISPPEKTNKCDKSILYRQANILDIYILKISSKQSILKCR